MRRDLHRFRRLVVPLLLIAIAGLGGVAMAAPANAASGDWGMITGTANLHRCSDMRCATTGTAYNGNWVQTWCWRDGGAFNSTARWFRITYGGRHTWVSASQMNPQPSVPYCDSLDPDEALFPGQSVWSANGAYRLMLQSDGNAVVYGPSGALWASNTYGQGQSMYMQSDGNLVIYGPSGAAWATGTAFANSQLVVQNDSNVVMYGPGGARWASNWHRYAGGQTRNYNAGAAGNCTWYAYDRWHSFWGKGLYPALTGNAVDWPNSARSTGWQVMDYSVPMTQAMVVMPSTDPAGHVAWSDAMRPQSDGTYVHIWEMNHNGLYVVDDRWVKVVPGFYFIPAPTI